MPVKKSIIFSIIIIIIIVSISAFYLTTLQTSEELPELTIMLGQEKCKRCEMIISDIRYAAAMYVADSINDWWKYDDIGEMVLDYLEYRHKYEIKAIKVHDFPTGEAVDAVKAWYVVANPTKLRTPMGYGVIAFKERTQAEKAALEYDGEVLDWNKLIERIPNIKSGE